MKTFISLAATGVVAAAFALGTPALAQSHYHGGHYGGHASYQDHGRDGDRGRHYERNDRRDYDRYDRHERYDRRDRYDRDDRYGRSYHSGWHDRSSWRRGGYVSRYDYDRGYVVDYRYQRGLYRPPYGYEWRRVDNNYVMVAIATGLIASIILNDGY